MCKLPHATLLRNCLEPPGEWARLIPDGFSAAGVQELNLGCHSWSRGFYTDSICASVHSFIKHLYDDGDMFFNWPSRHAFAGLLQHAGAVL